MIISDNTDLFIIGCELIFISDEIVNYDDYAHLYDVLGDFSETFWHKICPGQHPKLWVGSYQMDLKNSTRSANWENKAGTKKYTAGFYGLFEDEKTLYENPDENYEEDMVNTFGENWRETLNSTEKADTETSGSIITSDNNDYWFAVNAAQEIVKEELKSPASAKFSSSASDYVVYKNGDSWMVKGYVDADNSFGANVRTNWIASFIMGDTSGAQYKISDPFVLFDE